MKQVKVVTSSELHRLPARKKIFEGGIVVARAIAEDRARKYHGWSHIYAMPNEAGHRMLIEVFDRRGQRRVAHD